jgi:hypothetical protein
MGLFLARFLLAARRLLIILKPMRKLRAACRRPHERVVNRRAANTLGRAMPIAFPSLGREFLQLMLLGNSFASPSTLSWRP